jgi:uncharacterized protein
MKIPETVTSAWEKKEGPVVFTTVDSAGNPNSIYATCTSLYGEEYFVIADNYFSKTRKNILTGSTGSILFITDENKAYQIKGTIQYHKKGDLFDDMKTWNPEKHPGVGAAALKVDTIYSGAEQLL